MQACRPLRQSALPNAGESIEVPGKAQKVQGTVHSLSSLCKTLSLNSIFELSCQLTSPGHLRMDSVPTWQLRSFLVRYLWASLDTKPSKFAPWTHICGYLQYGNLWLSHVATTWALSRLLIRLQSCWEALPGYHGIWSTESLGITVPSGAQMLSRKFKGAFWVAGPGLTPKKSLSTKLSSPHWWKCLKILIRRTDVTPTVLHASHLSFPWSLWNSFRCFLLLFRSQTCQNAASGSP